MSLKKSVWYYVSVVWLWIVVIAMIGLIIFMMYEAGIFWIMVGILVFLGSIIAALARVHDES